MPPQEEHRPHSHSQKTLEQGIEEEPTFCIDAIDFVRRGLSFTVEQIHAEVTDPEVSRHVSGQQLCEGLRQYALLQWGLLARTVLQRWSIFQTEDFGKIVFRLIETGEMAKTENDTLEDFRHVFDFAIGFETSYRIVSRVR